MEGSSSHDVAKERKEGVGSGNMRGKEPPRLRVILWADRDHCVETAAKREYERLALAFLRGEGQEEMGHRLDLVKEFLETADFRSLRAQTEPLIQRWGGVRAVIFRESGRVRCEILEP